MEQIGIGGLGIEMSRIGLGTWAIGGWMWGGADEAQAVATVHAALSHGITLIDTAPAYGQGASEEVVGRALAERGRRDDVVIATKVGLEWDDAGEPHRNASPERVREEIEDSLRRLQTDYIDIYQVHWPDPDVPLEDTAAELEKLRDEGKIRAIGVSNFSREQMDAFQSAAPLQTVQPPYNLFERGVEDDVLPYCAEHDVVAITYGALCRGLLSGRMRMDTSFEGDDLRTDDPKFQAPRYAQYLDAVDALDLLAQQRFGRRVLHLAVRWLLDRPGVGAVLWGARRPEQLDPLPDVMGWTVDADAMNEIDRILADAVEDPVGPEFMAPPGGVTT
ncbi:MAG TPA: aldo/keto reductase [Longimicrobiales bacterium]|nr:aldo/keto reductase [Longimicrobiales bacterium]